MDEVFQTIANPNGLLIKENLVEAVGGRATRTSITGAICIGANTVILDGVYYGLMFYRDTGASDYITVWTYDGSSAVEHASTLVSASERVESVVYGDDVYFTHSGIGSVYKYTKSGPTFAAVSGSPGAGEFIFVLGNNMCVIKYNTTDDVWEVYWAVDSDPSDWSSVGSGNNVIPPQYGDVQGVGFLGESAVIICELGAYMMTPSNTIPAFNFDGVPEVEGCLVKYGVATGGGSIYYTGRGYYPMRYSGGNPTPVSPRSGTRELWSSRAFGCIVDRSSSNSNAKLIDYATGLFVGATLSTDYFDFFCDGPAASSLERCGFFFDNDSGDIDIFYYGASGGSLDNGSFYTPLLDLGAEAVIKEIDILKSGIASQLQFDDATSLYLYVYTNDGTKDTHTIGSQSVSMDGLVRVPVHAVGRAFQLLLIGVTDKFSRTNGVRGIRFHCKVIDEETVRRLSG
jgi:hypothetical protein